jgi:hypothetical protein
MRSAVSLMVAVYLELCVISWLGNFAPGKRLYGVQLC